MKRHCLALDLVDEPLLIAEYEHWHKAENVWPEIKKVFWRSALPICRDTAPATDYLRLCLLMREKPL